MFMTSHYSISAPVHFLQKENQGIEEPFFLLAHEWHKLYSEKKTAFDLIA
jgi:hypothetical protein